MTLDRTVLAVAAINALGEYYDPSQAHPGQ